MKCLIVDDNTMARMAMKQLVAQVPSLALVKECSDAIEAYHELNQQPIDLLLLDIEMPEMTGLELTRNLGDKCPLIIFTTANKDYAVEAFDLDVVDYLIKPVSTARFLRAVDRATDMMSSKKQDAVIAEKEFVFIKDNGILKKIDNNDILYLEAKGDYVRVHTPQKLHFLHTTLKSIEEKLPASKFVRVHRSFIVALNKIDFIHENSIFINNTSIPLSDSYRSVFTKRLNLL
ncbi:MAG: LytR/AlgR family response regulator transcription factor [Chitinophagaceae bacterium]